MQSRIYSKLFSTVKSCQFAPWRLMKNNVKYIHCNSPYSSTFKECVSRNLPVALKSNFLLSEISKTDPEEGHRKYKAPSVFKLFDEAIFGEPILIKPEIQDPTTTCIKPIMDPLLDIIPEIKVHKHDKYWRRRGMKQHRYLRWRKRNETLLKHRAEHREKKRALRAKQEIESIWKEAGLDKEPPVLSEDQKKTLLPTWKEEGIWIEALTEREVYAFATPQEPKNKKVLPPKKFARFSVESSTLTEN